MMVRKVYEAKAAKAAGPYSHAVDGGEYVYFSGQTAKNTPIAADMTGDIAAQTKQCFINLFDVLEETGLTETDVVKVNVYLTDMNDFEAMNEEYAKHFTAPYPARTCVAVLGLPLGAEVEIEMVAKKRT